MASWFQISRELQMHRVCEIERNIPRAAERASHEAWNTAMSGAQLWHRKVVLTEKDKERIRYRYHHGATVKMLMRTYHTNRNKIKKIIGKLDKVRHGEWE